MLNRLTAGLRKFLGKTREGHGLHAPFRVTTHRGHTVQTFQSLELALEAAESLGPDHHVIDPRFADLEPTKKIAA
jgi:ActR/RegA family two-component response regulator